MPKAYAPRFFSPEGEESTGRVESRNLRSDEGKSKATERTLQRGVAW